MEQIVRKLGIAGQRSGKLAKQQVSTKSREKTDLEVMKLEAIY